MAMAYSYIKLFLKTFNVTKVLVIVPSYTISFMISGVLFIYM